MALTIHFRVNVIFGKISCSNRHADVLKAAYVTAATRWTHDVSRKAAVNEIIRRSRKASTAIAATT